MRDVKVADHEDEHLNERKKADGVDLVSGAMRGRAGLAPYAALAPEGRHFRGHQKFYQQNHHLEDLDLLKLPSSGFPPAARPRSRLYNGYGL